jgi:hypothetical protein
MEWGDDGRCKKFLPPDIMRQAQAELDDNRCAAGDPHDGRTPLCAPDASGPIDREAHIICLHGRYRFYRPPPYQPPPVICQLRKGPAGEVYLESDTNNCWTPCAFNLTIRADDTARCKAPKPKCQSPNHRNLDADDKRCKPACGVPGLEKYDFDDTEHCKMPDPPVRIYLGVQAGFFNNGFKPGWSAGVTGIGFKLGFPKGFYASASAMAGTQYLRQLTVVADLRFGIELPQLKGYLEFGVNGLVAVRMDLTAPLRESMMNRVVGGGFHVCVHPLAKWDYVRPLAVCGLLNFTDHSYPYPGGRHADFSLVPGVNLEFLIPINGWKLRRP